MAFTLTRLEEIVAWCSASEELRNAKADARWDFFGESDPRPVNYWPGAEGPVAKDRRFLGWFALGHQLPDGRRPGEVAAQRLYSGSDLEGALKGVRQARYVLAVAGTIIPGRGLVLQLEDERFEVRSSTLSRVLQRGQAVVCWLVPSRRQEWILGPGWVEWPVMLGPNIRKKLKSIQPDPIGVERLLQMRATPEDDRRGPPPEDKCLEDAVARMTEAALAQGRAGLVMAPEQWAQLVVKHLNNTDITAFGQEIIDRIGGVENIDDLNRWIALATNIWNNTPQPDRGGKSARDLSLERLGSGLTYERWRGSA